MMVDGAERSTSRSRSRSHSRSVPKPPPFATAAQRSMPVTLLPVYSCTHLLAIVRAEKLERQKQFARNKDARKVCSFTPSLL